MDLEAQKQKEIEDKLAQESLPKIDTFDDRFGDMLNIDKNK